jgi:hypothetical protein
MAIPVISNPTNTSVLGWRQWQTWEFQPYATNDPTSWACAVLPPGMAIDAGTGLISGFATVPGVWNCPLIAHNGDGYSTPLILTIGIEPANGQPNVCPAFAIDLDTGHIFSADGSRSSANPQTAPLLWAKQNDQFPVIVRFFQKDVYVDPALSSLKFGLKALDAATLTVTGGGDTISTDFQKFGDADSAYYVLFLDFSTAALKSDVAESEGGPDGSGDTDWFYGLAEIEWQTGTVFGFGPGTTIRTSRTFIVGPEGDLITN